ncbi:MAG: hypothetical protein ACOC0J_00285 [Myxococcota bacterium]
MATTANTTMSETKMIDGEKHVKVDEDELVLVKEAIQSGEYEEVDAAVEMLDEKLAEFDD